jgi:hypothetical protein
MYTIKSYKAFNKDLKCKGFQYKIGRSYTLNGNIEMCARGFHACENPLRVLNFYPISTSRFAIVGQSGKIEREVKVNKVCSSKISIVKEIDLLALIREGINYTKHEVINYYFRDYDVINEKNSIFKNNIYRTYIVSNNEKDCVHSEGYANRVNSIGMDSEIYSNAYNEFICSSGDNSLIVSEGSFTEITSSGRYSLIVSTGNNSKIVVNSNLTKVILLGVYPKLSIVGNSCEVFSRSQEALISVIGDYATIDGVENSNIQCLGLSCKVKAGKGSFITLAERLFNGMLISKTEFVDGKRIKNNIWYKLNNGEFVEYDEESD